MPDGTMFEIYKHELGAITEFADVLSGAEGGVGRYVEWLALNDRSFTSSLTLGDLHFAARIVPCTDEERFVDRSLERLNEIGILPHSQYDKAAFATFRRSHAALYEHGARRTYISPEEARLVYAIAEIAAPRNVLVLGAYYGYWASWALPALAPNGRMLLVDPDPEVCDLAKQNVERLGFGQVCEIACARAEELSYSPDSGFDFVILDAEGPESGERQEFLGKAIYAPLHRAAMPALGPGAITIAHNILLDDQTGSPVLAAKASENQRKLSGFLDLIADRGGRMEVLASAEGIGVIAWP